MAERLVVSDASPLIGLASAGAFDPTPAGFARSACGAGVVEAVVEPGPERVVFFEQLEAAFEEHRLQGVADPFGALHLDEPARARRQAERTARRQGASRK